MFFRENYPYKVYSYFKSPKTYILGILLALEIFETHYNDIAIFKAHEYFRELSSITSSVCTQKSNII